MAFYYQNPQPGKVVPSFGYYVNSPLFNSSPTSRVPLSYFYAVLLRGDSALTTELFNYAAKESNATIKRYALQIIWLADNNATGLLLKKARDQWDLEDKDKQVIEKKLSGKPVSVLNAPVQSPESLDMLWAVFSATGDPEAVKKIASAVHFAKDGKGAQLMLGGAAQWSLTSQAAQHPRVLRVVQEEEKNSDGPQKAVLDEILKNAAKAKQPHKPQGKA